MYKHLLIPTDGSKLSNDALERAVQFAREASRKTTCSSHCKQLAMAATAHESLFQYFPNAGGTDVVSRFFTPDPTPYQLGVIDAYINNHLSLDENTVFVMTPEEYERATSSEKFQDIQVEQTLPYPDGRPGFYFVRLRYTEEAKVIFEQEAEARKALQVDGVLLPNNDIITVKYSPLDMGEIRNVFDGNEGTLARTLEANPFALEINFPAPVEISNLRVLVGGTETRVTLHLYAPGEDQPVTFTEQMGDTVDVKAIQFAFDAMAVEKMKLEILSVRDTEPSHVHLWEVEWE